jgi:hypothetical protein
VALALVGCTELPGPVVEPEGPVAGMGPVGDYAPMAAIVTHERLSSLAPALPLKLSELLGEHHVVVHHDWRTSSPGESAADGLDLSAVWMRDYQPIFVRDRDGRVRGLRYLSLNPHRSTFAWPDVGRTPSTQLPIIHENGNLVVAGEHVFVTEELLEDNAGAHGDRHLKKAGYRPRSREQLLALLAEAMLVAPERIVVLPRMPHEASGHVDLFLLALDDGAVMVPEIEERALASTRGRERAVAADVKAFLDEQAAALAARGLEVVRLPMIAPAFVPVPGEEAPRLVLFTPSNMLLVRLRERRVALLPGFIGVAEEAALAGMIARYTRRWEQVLAERGWQTFVVDAAQLVGQLGLFRCVSAVVPE